MRFQYVTCLLAAACGSGTLSNGAADAPQAIDAGAVACIPGLTGITLAPADSTIALTGGPAAPVTFTATGTRSAGGTQTLDAAALSWSATRSDDTPAGTIVAGVLSPNPSAGGVVTIGATDGCVGGTTTVTFMLEVVSGTPQHPGDWSGTPVTTGAVPVIVYPSDQTRFPRNIFRTLFQWRTGGHAPFRLTFQGPHATLTVYTDGAHSLCATAAPPAGCWEADETAWSYLAGSNAGESVTWVVDSLDTSGASPVIRRSSPVTIGFSKKDVRGAVFYWSTTSAGVRRANIAAAFPEDYITGRPGTTYPGDQVKCVACHVVSRSGKYLAAPVSAVSGQSLWVLGVTAAPPPTPLVTDVADTGGHGFASISPDDARVIAAWKGKMWLLDRANGQKLGDVPLGALKATHPDWSPDGKGVVFATGDGDAPGGAGLGYIPYDAGSWGTASVILPPPATKTNIFPMFSPDGNWIAFSQGKGGHGDLTLQLFLAPRAGGSSIELVAANRVVNNVMTDGNNENAQPTWAPPGDLDWIAFNSKRAYGVVLPAGTQQIWVAAVDRTKAGQAVDASYPAFHLQFQGLTENNHRAYWTLDVRDNPPPPPDAGVGPDARCIETGMACVPGADVCCGDVTDCDTRDDGVTYTCVPRLVP